MAYKPKKKSVAKSLPQRQEPVAQQPVAQAPIAQQPVPQQPAPQEQMQAEETEGIWNVQEMVTETAPVIVNNETGEKLDVLGALTKILNALEELEVE